MLRPQDTATRETKRLDGRWAFALDPEGVGRSEEWFAGPLRDARAMPVPASFNDIAAVASHEGGYTPFAADVSADVVAGDEVRVTVCVNNTLSFQSIPPGVIEDSPTGK